MQLKPEKRKLLHDIESKTASLKSAAKMLRECPQEEKKELIGLMKQTVNDILMCLSKLEQETD